MIMKITINNLWYSHHYKFINILPTILITMYGNKKLKDIAISWIIIDILITFNKN